MLSWHCSRACAQALDTADSTGKLFSGVRHIELIWNRYGLAQLSGPHGASKLNKVSPRNLTVPRDDESQAEAELSVM